MARQEITPEQAAEILGIDFVLCSGVCVPAGGSSAKSPD
ncbi:hypothetical protein N181_30020 [Sinorhizobium fredii USDA 205]|nr:hypothetical protein SF83666_b65920 [Sinorhizobium fredii CCBAU 83666]KSV92181.1 hypothetical protein N181_30020 [Sinorhizobium fredii USDA 205]